jgi:PIN domain nuclease of toxin-antitoxin system
VSVSQVFSFATLLINCPSWILYYALDHSLKRTSLSDLPEHRKHFLPRSPRHTQYTREAPLEHEIVVAAQGLQLPHQDPTDRFLAAIAGGLALRW